MEGVQAGRQGSNVSLGPLHFQIWKVVVLVVVVVKVEVVVANSTFVLRVVMVRMVQFGPPPFGLMVYLSRCSCH